MILFSKEQMIFQPREPASSRCTQQHQGGKPRSSNQRLPQRLWLGTGRLACSRSVRALQRTANHTTSWRWGSGLPHGSILSSRVASAGHRCQGKSPSGFGNLNKQRGQTQKGIAGFSHVCKRCTFIHCQGLQRAANFYEQESHFRKRSWIWEMTQKASLILFLLKKISPSS